MSIEITPSTSIKFNPPSDVLTDIIGPYSKKLKVALKFNPDDDLTQQEFKDESDINNIMARYMKTGQVDYVNKHQPQYADVDAIDFQEAMETVAQGKSLFAALPSAVRERFHNSPAEFLEFVNDEKNAIEAAKMGLLSPEATARVLSPTPEPKTAPKPSKPVEAPAEKPVEKPAD